MLVLLLALETLSGEDVFDDELPGRGINEHAWLDVLDLDYSVFFVGCHYVNVRVEVGGSEDASEVLSKRSPDFILLNLTCCVDDSSVSVTMVYGKKINPTIKKSTLLVSGSQGIDVMGNMWRRSDIPHRVIKINPAQIPLSLVRMSLRLSNCWIQGEPAQRHTVHKYQRSRQRGCKIFFPEFVDLSCRQIRMPDPHGVETVWKSRLNM